MVTILIATHNGAGTLPRVLQGYCKLESPGDGWELLIVDNKSTDHTKDVIFSYQHVLPITYLYEPRQGKNIALNSALPKVTGDLVVFTDDDTIPHPGWLKALRTAAELHSAFTIFGGPVTPLWESPPEAWITSWVPLGPTFALLDPLDEGPIHPRSVFGPNMAIRRTVFDDGYRFNEAIGPKGNTYAMGSETEFLRRLAQAGFQAWHCQDALVQHIIRPFQMSPEWILARAVRYGRGQYRMRMQDQRSPRLSLFGIPLSLLARIGLHRWRVVAAQWHNSPEHIFKARWQLSYLRGNAIEARLLAKQAKA